MKLSENAKKLQDGSTGTRRHGTVRTAQRGLTLPMTALMIVVLFAFAALAVDVGVGYTARTSAQHAADAAALAGAFTFVSQPFSTDPQTTAYNAAVAVAGQNEVMGQPVNGGFASLAAPCPAGGNTNWVCVDTANRRVSVNVARTAATGSPIATYFARVIGRNALDVATVATAEAGKNASGATCVQPVFIPNTIVSTLGSLKAACDAQQVLFGKDGNVTAYAQSQYNKQMDFRPLNPHQAQAPSQYYTVDYGAGGSTVRCTIEHCLNDAECKVDAAIVKNFTLSCGDTINTQPGNDVGNVRTGFTELISSGDTYDPNSGLIDGGSKDTSRQMVLAPVWDDCIDPWYTKGNISPGVQPLKVVGFAKAFVNPSPVPTPQGQVSATLVQAVSCAGAPANPGTGPFAIPVRLIQKTN